jgi:hypothetical protein
MRKIPKCVKKYFWDVDAKDIDMEKNKFFVIKRILENGDEKAVKWMFEKFNIDDIKFAVLNLRGYNKKTLNFWNLILDLKVGKCYDWR